MDGFSIPPTIYIAFGVIIAALLTGFFSFLNMVSAKENKVSEFRLAWVDGLREEIASYTSAVQELVRIEVRRLNPEHQPFAIKYEADQKWLEASKDAFTKAIENMSRIQLRLNPNHVREKPDSQEALLMKHVNQARELFNGGDYEGSFACCIDIRLAAAPLLKTTWDLVKSGEPEYQKIRNNAQKIVVIGTAFTLSLVVILGIFSLSHSLNSPVELKRVQLTDENGLPQHNIDVEKLNNPVKNPEGMNTPSRDK